MARAKPLTGLDPNASTEQNARCIARTRLDEMYCWAAHVDNPYEVRGLHNLRIAAKRLRYTLEVFEDVLPRACRSIAGELSHIQDELGALHDGDVIIALLRLCLGGVDAGVAFEQSLQKAGKQKVNGKLLVQPALVADVLNPHSAPTAEQRFGLEQLLHKRLQMREESYRAFRQHWYQLQARDFRRELLDSLNN
ncbi:MAG TPA: CHAD domain-containing protein [Ktedonobacteraceae bacterium]